MSTTEPTPSLYLPPQFRAADRQHAIHLMRAHPLASLISVDDEGQPFVTHLPLHVSVESDDALVLLGHCAKPNPHSRHLRARPSALVTFMGPQAYMSPSVYPDLTRVPTWNYVCVHARVRAMFIETFDDKDRMLKHLIHDHDPAYAQQWRALPQEYQHKMMNGITAFELHVTELQCKIKLNQHRPESHQAMRAAYLAGDDGERGLVGWMDRVGI